MIMKSIKELVEKSPVLWLLSTLLVGFLAGISGYKTVQGMAGLMPVSSSLIGDLRNRISLQEKQASQKSDQIQILQKNIAFARNVIVGKHIDVYTKDPNAEATIKLVGRFTSLQAIAEVKDAMLMQYSFADKFGIHVKSCTDHSHLLGVCIKIMVPECASLQIHGISNNYFSANDPTDIRIYLPTRTR